MKKQNEIIYMFSVPNIRDFEVVVKLLDEHHLPVECVTSRKSFDGANDLIKEIIEVRTKGDENHIEFVKYLLKKYQDKAQKLLDKIKVK